MLTRLFVALSLLSSTFHNYAHGFANVPTGTRWALIGIDAQSGQECALFVMSASEPGTSPDQWTATVLTSYSHDGDAADLITVRAVANRPGTASGIGPNGKDQIAIFMSSPDLNLRNATSFNLRWYHVNHFHTERCNNLRIREL